MNHRERSPASFTAFYERRQPFPYATPPLAEDRGDKGTAGSEKWIPTHPRTGPPTWRADDGASDIFGDLEEPPLVRRLNFANGGDDAAPDRGSPRSVVHLGDAGHGAGSWAEDSGSVGARTAILEERGWGHHHRYARLRPARREDGPVDGSSEGQGLRVLVRHLERELEESRVALAVADAEVRALRQEMAARRRARRALFRAKDARVRELETTAGDAAASAAELRAKLNEARAAKDAAETEAGRSRIEEGRAAADAAPSEVLRERLELARDLICLPMETRKGLSQEGSWHFLTKQTSI